MHREIQLQNNKEYGALSLASQCFVAQIIGELECLN